MPGRRRVGYWVAGVLGLAVAAALSWGLISRGRHHGRSSASVVFDDKTPLPALTEGLREGDARALVILFPRMAAQAGAVPKAATEAEAREMIEILTSMRTGFLQFGGYGRVSSLMMVTKILERFAVEGAPSNWSRLLQPVHELYASGLADTDLQTRIVALNEVGRFWSWFPGRSMIPAEESALFDWKNALYAPVIRRLGDPEPQARVAAVACLGNLPDDASAAPAIACLEDKKDGAGPVRKQVLISFAQRPILLTDDAILKRLHDPEPGIPETAELLLSTRGLNREQIELGRLIFDPRPEHRASVIPRLRNRTDIDPVVWLLQLSRDASESVRNGAVAALAERPSPEVLQRLGEIARSDESLALRLAAGKLLPPGMKTETATTLPLPMPAAPRHPGGAGTFPAKPKVTVSLPPLPGSPSLSPRAN
jgi:hypothetical protein